MQISVFWDHLLEASEQSGKEVSDILGQCKAAGIEAVEINYSYFKANVDWVWTLLKQVNMKISCFYQQFDWGQNPDITLAKEMVETAQRLEVKRILAIPGFLKEADAQALAKCSTSYEETASYMNGHREILNMQSALTELTAFAAPYEVTITLEDFDALEAPFARTWQLLWFLKEVPGLCYTLDMGNFVYSDEDVQESYEILKDYIVHVHCKDRGIEPYKAQGMYNKGMASVAVGEGYIPIKKLVKDLKKQGYKGYLAIEHFGAVNQEACIKTSAAFLESCINDI